MVDPRALLFTILTLPGSYGDPEPRGLESFERRMHIAEAVAAEARAHSAEWSGSSESLAIAALTTMWEETRLDSRIHAGVPHPVWDEDKGRATCLGQLHVSGYVPKDEWARLDGTDLEATRRCARATIRTLVRSQRYCSREGAATNIAITLAAYAGRGCQQTPRSRARQVTFNKLMHVYGRKRELSRRITSR